jgi:integrase
MSELIVGAKTQVKRNVALSNYAMHLIELMRGIDDVHLFTVAPISKSQYFWTMCKQTGIEDLRFHDSRHEAITRLARKLDVLDLARMIGHRDLKSLMIYYNATASEIAARLD